MIVTFGTNGNPMQKGLMASKSCSDIIRPLDPGSFFDCDCLCGCRANQIVFGHPDGSWWKNDISSFRFRRVISTDTITIYLFKNGSQVATLNSNTLGIYYDFGSLNDPNIKGFQLHWGTVLATYGFGEYFIRAEIVSLGQSYTDDSIIFELQEYTDLRADGTVRIETYMNGFIESSGYDFTGDNWYQSYRIEGYFGDKKPTFVTYNYLDSARNINQIQDSIRNSYQLETRFLPSSLLNAVTYDGLLANRILITDYNLCKFEPIQRIEVYPESIDEFLTYQYSTEGSAVFKFTDKRQNILKRNFR